MRRTGKNIILTLAVETQLGYLVEKMPQVYEATVQSNYIGGCWGVSKWEVV